MVLLIFFLFFFFFQAEDGIRDHCVTGVQTCALPILTQPLLILKSSYYRDYKIKSGCVIAVFFHYIITTSPCLKPFIIQGFLYFNDTSCPCLALSHYF